MTTLFLLLAVDPVMAVIDPFTLSLIASGVTLGVQGIQQHVAGKRADAQALEARQQDERTLAANKFQSDSLFLKSYPTAGIEQTTFAKYGGWVSRLKKMDKGGKTPPKKNDPIFVTDPNDPRLKAYNDSLSLYKKTVNIENPKYYEDGQPSWWTFKGNRAQAQKFMEKNNIDHDYEYYRTGKFPGKIQPKSTGEFGEGMAYPKYKNPVQPVFYKKDKEQTEVAKTVSLPDVTPNPASRLQVKSSTGSWFDVDSFAPDYSQVRYGNTNVVNPDSSRLRSVPGRGAQMAAGGMIKRADGSYSQRGLWDNIRANKGSGKEPTAEMLKQERKIKAESKAMGGTVLPDYIAEGGEVVDFNQGNVPQAGNFGKLSRLSSNMTKINGDSHDAPSGGVEMAGGERVYTDRIIVPQGFTSKLRKL